MGRKCLMGVAILQWIFASSKFLKERFIEIWSRTGGTEFVEWFVL